MKKLKQIGPGDTLTLRIPNDVDESLLAYINEARQGHRNKHLLNLLFSKIKEEMGADPGDLHITLPTPLSDSQKEELKKSLSSIIAVLSPAQNIDKTVVEPIVDDETLESMKGLLQF